MCEQLEKTIKLLQNYFIIHIKTRARYFHKIHRKIIMWPFHFLATWTVPRERARLELDKCNWQTVQKRGGMENPALIHAPSLCDASCPPVFNKNLPLLHKSESES